MSSRTKRRNVNDIKNKFKRLEVYNEQRETKIKDKKAARQKRKRERELLGEDAPARKEPRTIENTRVYDETIVPAEDEEIEADEDQDEFSKYFNEGKTPKIVITSSKSPSKRMYTFIRELLHVFPNSFFYPRKKFPIKEIVDACIKKDFTDVLVINDSKSQINALTHIHLPGGPTAYYKITNLVLHAEMGKDRGKFTTHRPEVILNNFDSRLGRRMGRMLGSLFEQQPNFHGRRVCTFHNQRDFIFFRHHRYMFDSAKSAKIQELGPQFTLNLEWLQHGTFDTKHGEYEWKLKNDTLEHRKQFAL